MSHPIRRLQAIGCALSLLALLPMGGCGGGGAPVSPVPEKASPPASAAAYQEVEVTDGGSVEGTVLLAGEAPPPKKIRVARPSDQTVCGKEKTSDALRVGSGGEVANVVVYVDGIHRGKPLASLPAPPPVDQEQCQYVPHVAIYPAGVPLVLKSSDALLHNVHAYSQGGETLFNAAMPRKGMTLSKPLPASGRVTLRCDVHEWMNGAVWITDHPYATTTGESGKFRLADIPPGKYLLKAWHPVLGEASQEVEVTARGTAGVTLRMTARR